MQQLEEVDMSKALEGKVAAVTGGASGIGLACARAMAAEGARVVLVDRDAARLANLHEEIGEAVIPLALDLLKPEDCASMVPRILEMTGQIDILHANAGTYIGGDLVEVDAAVIDRMLNLNVNVVIKNVHDVLPHMIGRGAGDVVVTSSVAGHFPVPWEPVYSPSKWAMTSFVQIVRRQVLKHGIRVGSVSPGPVVTALVADWPKANFDKAMAAGALIEPKEVADAVLFMLTRPRNVTIRDIVVLPSNFDI
jgi:ribitol 2-dehydrogenase